MEVWEVEKQERRPTIREEDIIGLLIGKDRTFSEISDKLNIPTSSLARYLNELKDKNRIKKVYDNEEDKLLWTLTDSEKYKVIWVKEFSKSVGLWIFRDIVDKIKQTGENKSIKELFESGKIDEMSEMFVMEIRNVLKYFIDKFDEPKISIDEKIIIFNELWRDWLEDSTKDTIKEW